MGLNCRERLQLDGGSGGGVDDRLCGMFDRPSSDPKEPFQIRAGTRVHRIT